MEVVTNQQIASALKAHDKIEIFVCAAITPMVCKKNKDIEKYAPVIRKLTNGKPIMERRVIASLETNQSVFLS